MASLHGNAVDFLSKLAFIELVRETHCQENNYVHILLHEENEFLSSRPYGDAFEWCETVKRNRRPSITLVSKSGGFTLKSLQWFNAESELINASYQEESKDNFGHHPSAGEGSLPPAGAVS